MNRDKLQGEPAILIKNKDDLLSKSFIEARKIALHIIEATIEKINYYKIIKRAVSLNGDLFKINDFEFNLNDFKNIYLVGGGKNVSFMTLALEEIFGDRIREGIVVEKKGCRLRTKKIPLIEGGHPIPDQDSINAAKEIIQLAKKAKEDDLFIMCVSGGWTALASLPPHGITFKDFCKVYDLLLKSGMTIKQMNIVRNHLSRLGKGKLPLLTKSTVLGLIAVDEIEGLPWGPTVPANSSFSDSIDILKKYDMFKKLPASIKLYFEKESATQISEKKTCDNRYLRVHNFIIANNKTMCKIAQEEGTKLGINTYILSTTIEGEAKHVGTAIASIAKEISNYGRPFKPPCILILGGETTVTIAEKAGEGGRNQELALSAALKISKDKKILLSSIGTDGTDGPTNIAGALVDGMTLKRAKKKKIDVINELNEHNSSFVFRKLGDAIFTYDTGTNLMDLLIVYIAK